MERLEKIFYTIGGIGAIIIMMLCIAFVNNPFEWIKGINYDYPMFLIYSVPIIIVFFIILYVIYRIILKVNKGN